METKVIHLHFKNPDSEGREIEDSFFGSLKAIYDKYSRDDIGITYKPLTNAMRGKDRYENKKVIIHVGVLERKPNKK